MCLSSWRDLRITSFYIWCTTRKLFKSLTFSHFINDICKISKSCEIILFADDRIIFVSAGTQELAFATAQTILNITSNYMNCNKLHVHIEKSCYMYFNNTRKTENTERSNNFVLNIAPTHLFLKLKISNSLV